MRFLRTAIADLVSDEALPLRLTLLILLLRPPAQGAIRGLTWLVAGSGLVFPALIRSSFAWLSLAALVGARLVADWPLSDNHIYLLGYWCLGLGLCLRLPDADGTIARMSRWLVGSVFLCAILWKGLLTPDFLDARFFRVTLITDDRFAVLTRTIGGLTEAQLGANRTALVGLPAGAEVIDGPVLVEPNAVRRLGLTLAWGGLLLEAALAWTFLARWPSAIDRRRHVLLMAFAVATYAAAPVAGFGWLLAAMGCAQCPPNQLSLRTGYALVFILVLVYAETPLVPLLLEAFAP